IWGAQPPRLWFGAPSRRTGRRTPPQTVAEFRALSMGREGAAHCTQSGRAPPIPQLSILRDMQRWSMPRRFDHIDLRVPDLKAATPFYELLLPALGFTRKVDVDGWLQFEAADGDITEFFGVTESANHAPNENRIAFWAESKERVDALADLARKAGA